MARAALGPCCLTLQSISEFYSMVTRKGTLKPAEAVPIAEALIRLFRTARASSAAVGAALNMAAAGRASYWDALLITTAAEAGCTAILSEDFPDGDALAGVRVINPFAAGGLSPAAKALLDRE
jgi:predicted nucleic acid-binding protein